ncbi:hypothetical protein [Acidovorax delafieldii]|uniref:hypothetical protein n=1 Tax=Acidovorax delafieldii TaxID=47920 RepID=UPI0018E0BFCD|nr:hypothetical protein [Acidovorax delafieldii]
MDSFVVFIVMELQKSLPPQGLKTPAKQTDKMISKVDDKIRSHARQFSIKHPLNIYQKAKIGPRLQEALQDVGYSENFSKDFAYDIVRLVAITSTRLQ